MTASNPHRFIIWQRLRSARACVALSLFAFAFTACDPDGELPDESEDSATVGDSDGPEPGDDEGFLTPDPQSPDAAPKLPPGGKDKDKGKDKDEDKEESDDSDESADEDPSEGDDDGAEPEGEGKPKDPAKLLEEADVVHMEGDIAYVLSELSGLHLLDLADPANIKLLGSLSLEGVPFEMYVEKNQVVVMVRELQQYDEKSKRWLETSEIVRINADYPDKLKVVDRTRVRGRVADSRKSQDFLYLVSYENGRCLDCDAEPKIRLSSVKAAAGQPLTGVDESLFAQGAKLFGQPSAYFSGSTVYITLPESGLEEGQKGRVLRAAMDASNGELSDRLPILVDGRVSSRWQMNEHKGTFRVFSQASRFDIPPMLETFDVAEGNAIRLAALSVKLPRPEDLKSARFDGDRGYLITFRRTDPLFTFDLKDPANPKQLGELEIPGWVYHMEPRGDRLLGVGYSGTAANRLSMTLFDVSDLSKPEVLSRVEFGGRRAEFSEDQDRIHKSVKILDDKNLVLVPYVVGSLDEEDDFPEVSEAAEAEKPGIAPSAEPIRRDCGELAHSAVQILDWNGGSLAVRGAAKVPGSAHRSLIHRDRLIAISDDAVAAFDIADRDKPKLLDDQDIAVDAQRLLRMGPVTVRVAGDGYNGARRLEVVAKDKVQGMDTLSSVSLGSLTDLACDDGRDVRINAMFAHKENLYVVFNTRFTSWRKAQVAVVSLKDPKNPKVLGSDTIDRPEMSPISYLGNMRVRSDAFGSVGDRVVIASVRTRGTEDGGVRRDSVFTVLKTTPEGGLAKEVVLERENTVYAGGLVPAGNELGSWHAKPSSREGYLRFFYDRFFIDADGHFRHQAINVPGAPLGMDAVHRRVMSVDFELVNSPLDPASCKKHVNFHRWDWLNSTCVLMNTRLQELALPREGSGKASKLARHRITEETRRLSAAFMHENRVFALSKGKEGKLENSRRILAGLDGVGMLERAAFPAVNTHPLRKLNGAQAMDIDNSFGIRVYDARDVTKLSERSYRSPVRWCNSVQIDGTQLQCALGRRGVSLIDPLK